MIEKNKTYHLCIEDKYLSYFIALWRDWGKPCPFQMRPAKENIQHSFVVSIKDKDGEMIDFLATLVANTRPKIRAT